MHTEQKKHTFSVTPANSKFSLFIAFICMLYIFSFTNNAHAKTSSNVHMNKYAAFVMDANTGQVLHRYNANKSLHPASLTKMMTLLMLFDAIDHGAIKLNDKIRISKHAASMIPSKIGLEPGETIPVKDAINTLAIKSANDIAVAVAEKLGGSEEKFALMMTKKARDLGMSSTRFKNASGLHHPNQVSTASDMAKLGRALITKYGKHYHYFSQTSFTYKGTVYKSHNKLMKTYAGMDGLKTGYIQKSGFNLVSSAVRGNHRLIGVVFGGKTGNLRNDQMRNLLDTAFAKVDSTTLIAQSSVPLPQKKPAAYTEVASLEPYKPKITWGTASKRNPRWDVLNDLERSTMFNRMIGQGDYDITARNRIETGMIAIAAQLNENIPPYILTSSTREKAHFQKIPLKPELKNISGNWTIQIGAFTNRSHTDTAITQSLNRLPSNLNHGKSIVAPLKTKQGWIYRGRLEGYSKEAAQDACKILNDCIALSPRAI